MIIRIIGSIILSSSSSSSHDHHLHHHHHHHHHHLIRNQDHHLIRIIIIIIIRTIRESCLEVGPQAEEVGKEDKAAGETHVSITDPTPIWVNLRDIVGLTHFRSAIQPRNSTWREEKQAASLTQLRGERARIFGTRKSRWAHATWWANHLPKHADHNDQKGRRILLIRRQIPQHGV
jgi:hypothetical protein